MPLTSRRHVVVTGLGCVSPLGATADETWEGAIEGRSGVGEIQRFDCSGFPVQIAAEAPSKFEIGELPAKEVRRLDRFVLFALAAAREAYEQARLRPIIPTSTQSR